MLTGPEFGLDPDRLIHTDQRFGPRRPLHPGDRVRVAMVVEAARAMGDRVMLGTAAELVQDGELVATVRMTLLVMPPRAVGS